MYKYLLIMLIGLVACGGQSFEETLQEGRYEIVGEIEKHGTRLQFIEVEVKSEGEYTHSSLLSAQFGKMGTPDLIHLASQTEQLTLPEIWIALSDDPIPSRIAQYQEIEAWALERESPAWIETIAPLPMQATSVEKAPLVWDDQNTFLLPIVDFRQVNPLFVHTVNDGSSTTLSCTGQPGPRLDVWGLRFFSICNNFLKKGWVRIGIANISGAGINERVTPMWGPATARQDWQLMSPFIVTPGNWTVWNWSTTAAKGLGFQTLATEQLPRGPGDIRWYTAEVVPR